jgi:hypothetical protein
MSAKAKELKTPTVVSIDPTKVEICPRDEKGRFLKGFSGNPHAWATRKMNTQLALLCRENVETNLSTLQSIINNNDVDPAVRVAAIKLSFEYGYGKPMQSLDMQNAEHQDYKGLIKYLAREVHQEVDLENINAAEDAEKIKAVITKRIEDDLFLNKIYDDVLQHIGSYSFENYERKLKENGGYYKFYD